MASDAHTSETTVPGEASARIAKEYVDAGGVRTYYEVEGAGEPLVMLHGGLCAIETFGALRSALVERHRIYLPERRGHGRTPDVEGPYSYEVMARDTIAFMDAIALESAHILGWSDGASVGLLTALQRPDLVRKLVLIGQPANLDGIQAEFLEMLKLEKMPQEMLPPMLKEIYAAVSPDGPEHWDVVVDKAWQMFRIEPNLEIAELGNVSAPTLLLLGENDIVTIPHAEEMHQALPESKLVVVPGATHGLPMEKPEVVSQLVLDFLAGDSAEGP
jgi:pimeloyl-ACP methyl ester carboxylesterase